MNLTKRTLCIIVALAMVFTTLVFVSVGASIDFPVHDSPVTYNGGSTMNCKQSVPEYAGNNKIAYVGIEDKSAGAYTRSMADKLAQLAQESEYAGDYISIDVYAEFTSTAANTRVPAAIDFGAGKVTPSAKNTNVTNPTADYSFEFVNNKLVTLKFLYSELIAVSGSSIADLDSVAITINPAAEDSITGTFFYSVPYIASSEIISTVPVTSLKTTTTKANEAYDGSIAVYDNGVKYVGKHADAKAQWGTVNKCTAFYGDYAGYENTYLHVDGSGKQMQVLDIQMSGLAELRSKAITEGKVLCIDVYANDFKNGTISNAKCDLILEFNGGKRVGDSKDDLRTLRSGIKQTILFNPEDVGESSTKMGITLQNYSYGDYANITNAEFIFSVPYMEGEEPVEIITPSTTTTTTAYLPPAEAFTGDIVVYDNGVTYTNADCWNGSCTAYFGDFAGSEKKYIHIDGKSSVQQIQGRLTLSGCGALIEKAKLTGESIYIDIYANNFTNGSHSPGYADFKALLAGGTMTGDKDCVVKSNMKQTLRIPLSKAGNGGTLQFQIQNYSYGDYSSIKGGKFILSVPYLQGDVQNGQTITPSTTTTTTTTTTLAQPDYEEGDLPLKAKDTEAKYVSSNSWGKPEAGFKLGTDGASMSVINPAPKSMNENVQLKGTTEGFDKVILKAAEEGKNIAIDVYGNFLVQGKSVDDSVAKIRFNFGINGWFGNNQSATVADNINNMVSVKPKQVTTIEYNAKALLDIARSQMTTTKKDTSVKESESLTKTGDAAYSSFSQSDISPTATLDQFDNTKVGQYIEYKITGMTAATYNLTVYSRDYSQRGVFDVYANGTLIKSDLDFTTAGKQYSERSLGQYTLASDGDIVLKFVCKKASAGSVSMAIDKFKVVDANATTTASTAAITDADIAKKFNTVHAHVWGTAWNAYNVYGRIYMSAPYVAGAEEIGSIQGETTTTTTPIPTQPTDNVQWSDISEIDLGYVDCKIDRIEWPAGNSTAVRGDNAKYVKLGVQNNGQSQQVGAKIIFNAGNTLKKFPEYLEYARQAGENTKIAIDVYPHFGMSSGGNTYCHMNTTWSGGDSSFKWPTDIKAFKIQAGKKFTYYVDPDDIPDGSTTMEVYFDSYEYSPGWRAMTDVDICMTAPYLVNADEDKTTTTTTSATTKRTTTSSISTKVYPSFNVLGTTKFYVEDANIVPGGTVRVPIMVDKNAGLYNAKFSVKFNAYDLNLVSVTAGDVFDRVDFGDIDEAIETGVLTISAQSNSDTTKNGVVAYLEFDAPVTEDLYPISFAGTGYIPSNFFNYDGQNVPCSFRTGYVIVDTTGTRTREPDPDAYRPYPTANSGTTKFTISSVVENYVAGASYKDYSVNIAMSGNAGLAKAKFTVKYDPTKLEFLGSTPSKTVPPVFNLVDYNLTPVEYDKGIITYDIDVKDTRLPVNSTNNGDIVTLKFRLSKYEVGSYSIEFGGESYDANAFKNAAGNLVPCAFQSGGIEVKAPSVGTTKIKSIKLVKKTVAKITWKKAANAVSYEVYRATGSSKSFKKIKTVKTTSFQNKKLKAGTKYTYKIVPVNGSVKGTASKTKAITTMKYATKPVIKAVKPASKALKVTIKSKVKGAKGYQIQYATNSKFSGAKAVFSTKLTKTVSKLSAGQTYYVRVRAYNMVKGKKTFGSWSKVTAKATK